MLIYIICKYFSRNIEQLADIVVPTCSLYPLLKYYIEI